MTETIIQPLLLVDKFCVYRVYRYIAHLEHYEDYFCEIKEKGR